jgi:hypothetical protein
MCGGTVTVFKTFNINVTLHQNIATLRPLIAEVENNESHRASEFQRRRKKQQASTPRNNKQETQAFKSFGVMQQPNTTKRFQTMNLGSSLCWIVLKHFALKTKQYLEIYI